MEGTYTLSRDLDCSRTRMSPVGGEEKVFRGTLDGAGYTVSGVSIISSKGKAGLFSIGKGAIVKNLIFQDFHVESEGSSVGLIFGEAKQVLIQNVTLQQKPFGYISSRKGNVILGEGEKKNNS